MNKPLTHYAKLHNDRRHHDMSEQNVNRCKECGTPPRIKQRAGHLALVDCATCPAFTIETTVESAIEQWNIKNPTPPTPAPEEVCADEITKQVCNALTEKGGDDKCYTTSTAHAKPASGREVISNAPKATEQVGATSPPKPEVCLKPSFKALLDDARNTPEYFEAGIDIILGEMEALHKQLRDEVNSLVKSVKEGPGKVCSMCDGIGHIAGPIVNSKCSHCNGTGKKPTPPKPEVCCAAFSAFANPRTPKLGRSEIIATFNLCPWCGSQLKKEGE